MWLLLRCRRIRACSLHRAGILGENLQLPPSWTEDHRGFYVINATTLTVGQQQCSHVALTHFICRGHVLMLCSIGRTAFA
jgi:hypothetical protein